MKIEMGESLFYSWLRHVKDCQLVQTNWKASTTWNLMHEDELEILLECIDNHFTNKYGYKVFKKNASLLQIIQQGECDVLGVSINPTDVQYYAVDVAFHEDGLNYGSKDETVMKVISKLVRTAMCLYGFLGVAKADLIFASPKINRTILTALDPCIFDANEILKELGYDFHLRLIANEEFHNAVLDKILIASDGIADTNELFVRSYQMYKMFAGKTTSHTAPKKEKSASQIVTEVQDALDVQYIEFKVGKLANVVLRKLLESGAAEPDEVRLMQTAEHSKQYFHLNYPLLVRNDTVCDSARYYSAPLTIDGVAYKLCSQWFETNANNDRPYLLEWISKHT